MAKTESSVPGGYSQELESWLRDRASLMGERSNFAGIVAAIEKGATGGNSGTKGCGIVRIEPFESWESLHVLHDTFERAGRCELAFRELTTFERWLACARYLYRRETVPAPMHLKLGHLSCVALVVAGKLGLHEQLLVDGWDGKADGWLRVAEVACEAMHQAWSASCAEVRAQLDVSLVEGE